MLEDMLRMCVLDWRGHWADHLSLVEFAYNNSYQASIGMAPFEALYRRPCRTPLWWSQVGEEEHIWCRLCSGDHREDPGFEAEHEGSSGPTAELC